MNEENKGSVDAGSPKEGEVSNVVPKEVYDQLETKLGSQGEELGKFRTFFQEMSPLFDKLQAQPEVVEAILSGKIDASLALAVSEGKFKIEDAATATQAHEEVKKDLGKKGYANISDADLEKLIKDKMEEIVSEKFKSLDAKIDQHKENREYEDAVGVFLKNTPDFAEYAEDVKQWYKDHPDQYDIEIAYNAVKGKKSTEESISKSAIEAAEEAKRIASGQGQGESRGGTIIKDKAIIDELISSRTNPNVL